MDHLDVIRQLNTTIFDEQRIINTFDREDVLMLLARMEGQPVGFKIGYRFKAKTYYSAKGGVLPNFRRQGIARALLHTMIDRVRDWGYTAFLYDTFPNKHPGMTVLGLSEGFRVVKAGYSPQYQDYRLRFRKEW
jgi:GNAT superfamily N-acetyltransferase